MPYTHAIDIWIATGGFVLAGIAVGLTWAFTTLGKPPAGSQPMWHHIGDANEMVKPNIVELETNIVFKDGDLGGAEEFTGTKPDRWRRVYPELAMG